LAGLESRADPTSIGRSVIQCAVFNRRITLDQAALSNGAPFNFFILPNRGLLRMPRLSNRRVERVEITTVDRHSPPDSESFFLPESENLTSAND
jgi:hypothetical protein